MISVATKASQCIGRRASIFGRGGLCCYGLVRMCLDGVVEDMPDAGDVRSATISESEDLLSRSLRKTATPSIGSIALFRNGGMRRRRISEAHVAVVSHTRPLRVVHADSVRGEVVDELVSSMTNLTLVSYWRVK